MLKKIVLALAAAAALFVVIVAMQPADFRIERSATIDAPVSVVYGMINDFQVWDSWSPWSRLDPNMKKTLSGPTTGKGAIYEWSGNDQVGAGRMEIIDVRENEQVTIQLDFLAPMKARNTTIFTITPKGSSAGVTWTMSGKNGFAGKAFSLFMDMDEMVGADFEKGLAELGRQAKAQADKAK